MSAQRYSDDLQHWRFTSCHRLTDWRILLLQLGNALLFTSTVCQECKNTLTDCSMTTACGYGTHLQQNQSRDNALSLTDVQNICSTHVARQLEPPDDDICSTCQKKLYNICGFSTAHSQSHQRVSLESSTDIHGIVTGYPQIR